MQVSLLTMEQILIYVNLCPFVLFSPKSHLTGNGVIGPEVHDVLALFIGIVFCTINVTKVMTFAKFDDNGKDMPTHPRCAWQLGDKYIYLLVYPTWVAFIHPILSNWFTNHCLAIKLSPFVHRLHKAHVWAVSLLLLVHNTISCSSSVPDLSVSRLQ